MLNETRLTANFRRFERFARDLAEVLIERSIRVQFTNDRTWPFHGCYGEGRLIVNVAGKGEACFEGTEGQLLEKWIPFLIHEFAHDRVSGHLSHEFHRECCRLAGLVARTLVERPERLKIG
jgi:hypothetical protein